jgi:hypothetical protein
MAKLHSKKLFIKALDKKFATEKKTLSSRRNFKARRPHT